MHSFHFIVGLIKTFVLHDYPDLSSALVLPHWLSLPTTISAATPVFVRQRL